MRLGGVVGVLCVALLMPMLIIGRLLPQGPQVAYMTDRNGNWDIYVLDWNRQLVRLLTADSTGDDRYPMWSRDGTQLGYHTNSEGDYDLMIRNANGSDPQMLEVSRRFQFAQEAMMDWSPDGRYISFHSDAGQRWNIYLTDPAGDLTYQVTDNIGENIRLNWSPDGKRVAFASARDGGLEIYTMTVEEMLRFSRSAEVYARRMTNNIDDDWNPVWSPDSTQIAFISGRDFNREIYIMNADGTEQQNITNTLAVEEQHPAWTPDGKGLIYSAAVGPTEDLYYLDLETGERRRLTFDNRGNEEAPSLWWP